MPQDLAGKRVLDIGCNEGFFCNEATRRGARQVIGIDNSERFLNVARELYAAPNVEFIYQSWDRLPEGPFDLILWCSSMHYDRDPASMFRRIAEVLTDDGLFILECGVYESPHKEMVYTVRHDGAVWFPTIRFLTDALSDFAVRRVAYGERVGSDPVPRSVFHCCRRQPTVLLISGNTGQGKSAFADILFESATKVIPLDHFVARIRVAKWVHTDLQRKIKELAGQQYLGGLYHGIDEAGLTEEYASLLAQAVAQTDRLVIIEGYMTDAQMEALKAKLKGRAVVWDAVRAQ